MKKRINEFLETMGYQMVKSKSLADLKSLSIKGKELVFLENYSPENVAKYLNYKKQSKAQLKQDLFALLEADFKKGGFFIEFGATNGLSLSNTYLLENVFDWNGILAEPAKKWQHDLKKNRNVHIETDCVWSRTGETLNFIESNSTSLSTLEAFSDKDNHASQRRNQTQYTVNTISLLDLLLKYRVPEIIDFISIDTEGSEFDILNAFDFKKYRFQAMSIEHNYTENRGKIYNLLTANGYKRIHEEVSAFDDFYVDGSIH